MPFSTLNDAQRAALAELGVHEPNEVQRLARTPILSGQPVVIHAGTGTGKTLAYLLPVLARLQADPALRAVVLAPGTELVMQTVRVARAVFPPDVPVAAAASTTNRRRQKKTLTRATRLVVGTPDRVAERFAKRKLKGVGVLVLDELDPLLANPVSEFLERWLARSEPPLQVIVASATLGRRSEAFLARSLPDAVRLHPEAQPAIEHRSVRVRGPGKDVALARFVQEHKVRRGVVFASEPRQLAHLRRFLDEHGIPSVVVRRDASKDARKRGLAQFRSGGARLLLTTDRVARGLDLPEVDWVLNYDLPRSPQAYVHRAGRTGRAGRRGVSVVFADDPALGALRRLERALGLRFTRAQTTKPPPR